MRILVTGAGGQLGRTLLRHWSDRDCIGVDIEECDITDPCAVQTVITETKPGTLVHCAASRDVDACRLNSDPARLSNTQAP